MDTLASTHTLARRVAVLDACGSRIVFHAQREQAQRMISAGLAVRSQHREIRLTCRPAAAKGQSLPQYQDGETTMMARHYAPLGSFVRW